MLEPAGTVTTTVKIFCHYHCTKIRHFSGSIPNEPPFRMPRLIHLRHRDKGRERSRYGRSQDHNHRERPLLEGRAGRQGHSRE